MAGLFRFQVDPEALTDACYDFVVDSSATSRNQRPVILELHDILPDMVDVLECMVIDGVDERKDVADYVHSVIDSYMQA